MDDDCRRSGRPGRVDRRRGRADRRPRATVAAVSIGGAGASTSWAASIARAASTSGSSSAPTPGAAVAQATSVDSVHRRKAVATARIAVTVRSRPTAAPSRADDHA
jgi:hypothetical protein